MPGKFGTSYTSEDCDDNCVGSAGRRTASGLALVATLMTEAALLRSYGMGGLPAYQKPKRHEWRDGSPFRGKGRRIVRK